MNALNTKENFEQAPHHVRYELIDKDGNGGFEHFLSAEGAAKFAKALWPNQEQDPDRIGKGWDIQITEL